MVGGRCMAVDLSSYWAAGGWWRERMPDYKTPCWSSFGWPFARSRHTLQPQMTMTCGIPCTLPLTIPLRPCWDHCVFRFQKISPLIFIFIIWYVSKLQVSWPPLFTILCLRLWGQEQPVLYENRRYDDPMFTMTLSLTSFSPSLVLLPSPGSS